VKTLFIFLLSVTTLVNGYAQERVFNSKEKYKKLRLESHSPGIAVNSMLHAELFIELLDRVNRRFLEYTWNADISRSYGAEIYAMTRFFHLSNYSTVCEDSDQKVYSVIASAFVGKEVLYQETKTAIVELANRGEEVIDITRGTNYGSGKPREMHLLTCPIGSSSI
jgi:hypothetical protein